MPAIEAIRRAEAAAVSFEVRGDWPTGRLDWWEAVRLGLR